MRDLRGGNEAGRNGSSKAKSPHKLDVLFERFENLAVETWDEPTWEAFTFQELEKLAARKTDALESILESLEILGIEENRWREFIAATFLALRGWGGMVQQVEERGDRVAHPIPGGSLVEFLAVRLLLDRHSLVKTAREALDYRGPLNALRDAIKKKIEAHSSPSLEQRAFLVFQLAQILGWPANELDSLGKPEWRKLIEEIEAFSAIERRQIFHFSFERRFYRQTRTQRLGQSRDDVSGDGETQSLSQRTMHFLTTNPRPIRCRLPHLR